MKMTKKIRKLAKKAGFIFWQEGEQGHSRNEIDWGCDYSEDFLRFVKLLKKEAKRG